MLPRSLYTCFKCQPTTTFRAVTGFTHCLQSTRLLRTNNTLTRLSASFKPPSWDNREQRKRFRITMSEEEKARKLQAIEQSKQEEKPKGLVAKLKFYIKRYWYIAIPVHTINCSIWFVSLYFAVRSGIDVISLLETLHMPDSIVEKVKNTPPSAGHFVVALLLYKLALPLRYAVTLGGIQVAFAVLKRFGWLRTARELEYKVRSKYTRRIVKKQ